MFGRTKFPLPKLRNSGVRNALQGALAGKKDSRFSLNFAAQPPASESIEARISSQEAQLGLALLHLKDELDKLGNSEFTEVCIRAIKGKETSVSILRMTAGGPGPNQAVALLALKYIAKVKGFRAG